ncbi:hypothetical protein ACFVXH_39830 [Kitasatospora sp. NPDC058184]|uniref:hypothetical protein n=1 Tax=Kitasatospora sp. NPDC058184 TaxID=3346370 RepID=UPI0036D98866
MTSRPLRDEQGNRLHLHREHDHLPDDIRLALVTDIREMLVCFPQSAPARRQYLHERFGAGAPWAEPFFNRCITRLEEQAEKEWRYGQAAAAAERREREAKEKEDNPPPVVPGQRTEDPPSVSLVDDDPTPGPLRFSQRQSMTLLERHSHQRLLDINEEKAEAAKRRDNEVARLKEMKRAQKGHRGAMELARAITEAWNHDPDAINYEQVMRNAGLTYGQFGVSVTFFTTQLNEALPDDKVRSAQ